MHKYEPNLYPQHAISVKYINIPIPPLRPPTFPTVGFHPCIISPLLYAQLELEERTSIARVRRHRDHNEDGDEANGGGGGGGGGRGRARGRRGGGGGEGGEGGEENDEEGGEGRGRRVPPVAENSVYIKGFPDTTSEDDIRAEVVYLYIPVPVCIYIYTPSYIFLCASVCVCVLALLGVRVEEGKEGRFCWKGVGCKERRVGGCGKRYCLRDYGRKYVCVCVCFMGEM